jgi:probable phosphomutase (TIGR03848 family)
MPTLLLLRHGRTTSNAEGVLAGRTAVGLDEAGQAQARAVGDRLRDVPLAQVVSSPLARCRQTLELALPEAAPVLEDGLTECGYGDWEGQTLKKLAKEPLWRVVQGHPSGATFPGAAGESMSAMSARAVAAVRYWDEKVTATSGADALWLACSHGDVIKAIVADALGLHLDQFQRIVVDPCSTSIVRYTGSRPYVMRVNDMGSDLTPYAPPKRRRSRRQEATPGGGSGPGTT